MKGLEKLETWFVMYRQGSCYLLSSKKTTSSVVVVLEEECDQPGVEDYHMIYMHRNVFVLLCDKKHGPGHGTSGGRRLGIESQMKCEWQ